MRKLILCLSLVAGCSNTNSAGNPDLAMSPGVVPSLGCTDSVASIYTDPGTLPADKGAIIRCAKDGDLSLADLTTMLAAVNYTGKAPTSGAHVYRVLYRTERGDAAGSPGYTSAKVFLPMTPRATMLPVVVASHGSRGQAAACTASKLDPAADDVNPDYQAQMLPLVGAGYAVIAPDLSGYSNYGAAGNPPSAYASGPDVGKSTLDGARALRNLIPSTVSSQVVLVGHSQGGHTALSALALADTYGAGGTIAGVAVYSPLWLSQRTWGAVIYLAALFPFHDSPGPNAVALWYHYTHGELLDGPGHGLDVFAAAKRPAIKTFVDSLCWSPSYPTLEALGTDSTAIYDQNFQNAISQAAATGMACPTDPTLKPICDKWIARYLADRPHLTGSAKTTPMVVLYGLKDTTIPPTRMQCAIDRLTTDGTATSYCVEPPADHGGIVRLRADYVNDWIASKTLGGTAPAACTKDQTALVDNQMKPLMCAVPPPND